MWRLSKGCVLSMSQFLISQFHNWLGSLSLRKLFLNLHIKDRNTDFVFASVSGILSKSSND